METELIRGVTIIRGNVVGSRGRPIAAATVYVVSAPASMPDVAQITDDRGRFAVSASVPGRYRLGVRSDMWGVAEIDVNVGGEASIEIEVKLDGKFRD